MKRAALCAEKGRASSREVFPGGLLTRSAEICASHALGKGHTGHGGGAMTKFDGLQISHRRGRRVAEDHGVDHNVKLPAGGLEVTDDGWLRVAQPDNVGVCSGNSAARLGELDPPCVFFELERSDGSDVGVVCVEVCNHKAAPKCARAFIHRCEELVPFDRNDGGGGYVGAPISFDGIAAAHVAAAPPTANGVARNKLARARLEVEWSGEETQTFVASHRSSAASLVASLKLTDGSFSLMFGSEPSWDGGQERQAIGRVRISPDDDESARVADELKRAAAAAIVTGEKRESLRVRSCGSVLDDVGGRPFHAVLASSLRVVREAMDKISSRFESRDQTRRRIEAESEAVGRDVEDALRYALSQKRKAETDGVGGGGGGGGGTGVGVEQRKRPTMAADWDTLGELPSDFSDSDEDGAAD